MDDPAVVVVFRSGWRQSLDRATGFELWDRGEYRGTIPADLVLSSLMHHLRSVILIEEFRATLAAGPATPPPQTITATPVPPRTAPRLVNRNGRKLRGRKEPDHAP